MKNTKIDWATMSWNPVTGCRHGCQYCYARSIARRFAWKKGLPFKEEVLTKLVIPKPIRDDEGKVQPYPAGFNPTFHKYRLDEPARVKEPQVIFVCSMADLFGSWVPDEWIAEVFEACRRAPWHKYLFLTKNPDRYIELAKKDLLPREFWYGYSATTQDQLWHFHHASDCPCINLFISVEPILERMNLPISTHCPADWIILGAETGNRKGKIVPEREWIEDIVKTCEYTGTPLMMKNSLVPIVGEENMIRQFPWEGGDR